LGTRASGLTTKIGAVGAAIVFTTLKIANMIAEMESIDRRMRASIGDAKGVARAWGFLRETSSKLGLNLEDLASRYGSLAAASTGTKMGTEDLESIFLAVSEKAAILGMTGQRVQLTFLAIEQMASKGVISMEELRRQFGENVPGAVGIMARALGTDLPTLNKWVASGKLLAEDVLPLLANQMRKESAPAIGELGDTMMKSISGMKTAWFDLKKEVSGGVIKDAITGIINAMTLGITVANLFLVPINAIWDIMKKIATWKGVGPYAEWHEKFQKLSKESEDALGKTLFTEEQEALRRQKVLDILAVSSKQAIDEWKNATEASMASVAGEFTSFISKMATGADVSLGTMLNNMAIKLLDFTTTMLVIRPILEWFKIWLEIVTSVGGAGSKGLFGNILGMLGAKIAPSPPPTTAMADGGIINEPVVGVGMKSGGSYLLGESGPEAVIPTNQGGGSSNISVNINAVDSKSVTQLLNENPQAIIGPIIKAMKSGDRGLSASMRLAVG